MSKTRKSSMLIMAVGMLFFLGVIYAWSIFRTHINLVFPEFSASNLSLNFTITMIGFCFGGFLGGKITEKTSPSISARVSAILLLVGFLGTSFMGNFSAKEALILMYICYGVIAGLGTGIGYNACVSNVAVWFPGKIGLISGVLLMGFGLGSLVIGMVIDALSTRFGIFLMLRVLAIIVFAVLVLGSFFIKKPQPVANQEMNREEQGSDTPQQMLRKSSFWIYFCWNVVMSSAGLLVINSAANISVFYGGTAALGLIVSLFNGAGRPFVGLIMDKFGQIKGMTCVNIFLIVAGILLVATSVSGNVLLVCIGMFLVGICYGGGITISAKFINEQYGSKYYAVNFSLSNFCIIPASFIGPYISGMLMDKAGGDYQSTFVMLLGMAVCNIVFILILKLLMRKKTIE